ncbi:MAG: DEAD/DEAH box helicase family protein, partial [Candidatus Thioglobus sp.]
MPTSHSNFIFLQEHDPVFFQLASTAEQIFSADPNTTLIKLRQFAEALAQNIAARSGIDFNEYTSQSDLLFKINRKINLDPTVRQVFHTLRIEGNKATHEFTTQHKQAMDGLRIARALALWFHKSFGKNTVNFKIGAFIPPVDPSTELRNLQSSIEQLKAKLNDADEKSENNQQLTELITQEKEQFATLAEQMEAEAKGFEEIAIEHEAELKKAQQQYEAHLKQLQDQIDNQPDAVTTVVQQTKQASKTFSLNEELTRILIDQQLINAGWDADTQELTYQKGARPEAGKNKAIAEWPTKGQQKADYVLFIGLIPIAIVEAKRENTNVAGKIGQAERYSKGFNPKADMKPAWSLQGQTVAWPDDEDGHYQIPFVYSCNGRPYIKQLAEQSGTWFRDVREPSNIARALQDFHSPEGLLDKIKRSKGNAEEKLKNEGFGYLKLRDYQENAIRSVETAVENNQLNCLLAMATGTGKTRTIIGLMYRFLKAERFNRILFLVDRTALGQQAIDVFNEAPLEQNQTLSKIYNVAELG